METTALTGFSLSLESFEKFIESNPDAKNIVVSGDHIIEGPVAESEGQAAREAFRLALQAKYPDQANLVNEVLDNLKTSGESLNAHTIRQVIDHVADTVDTLPWKDVGGIEGEEEISPEGMAQITQAINEYTDAIENLPPEEFMGMKEQLVAAGLAISSAGGLAALSNAGGLTAIAANIQVPAAANTALANLITTVAAHATPAGSAAVALPMTHLAAAAATVGTAAVHTASTVAISHAAVAIVPFLIAGAVAHRIRIIAHRVERAAHGVEHEVDSIATAMLAAALATIPPAQHALLIATIVSGAVGQESMLLAGLGPNVLGRLCHNLRDAALGVYLFNHPEMVVYLAKTVGTVLFDAGKMAVALTATTGAATTGAATTGATAATATTGATVAHTASATLAASHVALTAVAHHGVSAAVASATTVIAAHPAVLTAMVVGGACAVAYNRMAQPSSSQATAS